MGRKCAYDFRFIIGYTFYLKQISLSFFFLLLLQKTYSESLLSCVPHVCNNLHAVWSINMMCMISVLWPDKFHHSSLTFGIQ